MFINSINELCELHTYLTKEEINYLYETSKQLQLIANLNRANIFIDCLTKNNEEVIVIAEASPDEGEKLYQGSVINQKVYEKFEPAVFQVLRLENRFAQHRAMTQEGREVEQNVTPIVYNEKVVGALVMELDISNKVMQENRLKSLTQATDTLSDLISRPNDNQIFVPDMIEESLFDLDNDLNIRYYNVNGEALVKKLINVECKMGLNFVEMFPNINDMLTDGKIITIEERVISGHYFQVKCIQLLEEGTMTGHLILLKDITDIKEKERELISKSVAIREVHHRVKNNLQTVASLLRLQMRRGLPYGTEKYFEESLNRILSIASVYEVILDESSTDSVNVEKLIKKIGNLLVYNRSSDKKINITYQVDKDINLVSNIAVSIALIANELITNCVTHAFNSQNEGDIFVKLISDKVTDIVKLSVQDNGEEELKEIVQSFGLKIVTTITENDLEGQFNIERNAIGTLGEISFQYKGVD